MTPKNGGGFSAHPMPKAYKTIEKFIKAQPDSFRTFWRPHNGDFPYYSQKHPLIRAHYSLPSTRFFLSDIWNPNAFKNTKDIAKVLGLLNVKYCFLPQEKENLWGIDRDFFISTFNNQVGLEKIDIGENIDIFENEKVIEGLVPKIRVLEERLEQFKELKAVGDVRQCGLIADIELVKNRETKEPYSWEEKIGMKVCLEARQRGLITRPLNNVLVIMPPLCINISQLNKMMDILYESLNVVTETG